MKTTEKLINEVPIPLVHLYNIDDNLMKEYR